MKEKMDKNSIDALIGYRCQRSDEAIQEAELLCREGFYNAAVNRLYYACYYVISALFLKDDIEAHTHSGMKTLFGMHYVKTEKISINQASIYYTLFEKRHSGDGERKIQKKDGFTQIVADWKRRWTQRKISVNLREKIQKKDFTQMFAD